MQTCHSFYCSWCNERLNAFAVVWHRMHNLYWVDLGSPTFFILRANIKLDFFFFYICLLCVNCGLLMWTFSAHVKFSCQKTTFRLVFNMSKLILYGYSYVKQVIFSFVLGTPSSSSLKCSNTVLFTLFNTILANVCLPKQCQILALTLNIWHSIPNSIQMVSCHMTFTVMATIWGIFIHIYCIYIYIEFFDSFMATFLIFHNFGFVDSIDIWCQFHKQTMILMSNCIVITFQGINTQSLSIFQSLLFHQKTQRKVAIKQERNINM